MKFKCIDDSKMEDFLTLGKIYNGEYSKDVDSTGRKMVEIERCDDGKTFVKFRGFRFEIVLEAC